MGGVVVLPTWMLHLNDFNEVMMDRVRRSLCIVKKNEEKNTFYETFGKNNLLSTLTFIHASYLKVISVFNFYYWPNK